MFLFDSDVMSQISSPTPIKAISDWYNSIDETSIYFCAITIMERRKGIERLRTYKPIKAQEIDVRFCAVLETAAGRIFSLDQEIAEEWGRMLAESEKHTMDTAVAATAKIKKLTVVTLNTKHYQGRGVQLLDPSKDNSVSAVSAN